MASSHLKSNPHHRVRSISLPSRPHPLTPHVDERLTRLRASEATSSSLSSIGNRLSALEDMYNSFDDFILLSKPQQAISKNYKHVEEVSDGYFRLLDFCATAKDISLQMKEDVRDLLFMLRRNRDGNELQTYLAARKRAKMMTQKSLKDLKEIKSKRKNNGSEKISSLFKDVEFESLMSYIAGTKFRSILSGLVIRRNILSSKDEVTKNVFHDVEDALHVLINTKKFQNLAQFTNLQWRLEKIESNIWDFEEGLECLFRRVIRTKVVLLNIVNH